MTTEERANLLAQADVTAELIWDRSPEPFKERYRALAAAHPRLALLPPIAAAAARYRSAECDGTPRLWRGKALQDLANSLDGELSRVRRDG